MIKRIGFSGLGMMGSGIAANLLKNGYLLTFLLHRNRQPLERFREFGVVEAASGAELAAGNDAVFLCVRGAEEVESLVYGSEGILDGVHKGMILVDATTSLPELSKRIAADLKRMGAAYVDAPVTRAPKDAEAGRLNSLVGADPEVFEQIRDVLDAYSETVVHFGPPGAGHSAKLINNFISCGYTALIIEGMALCERAGVDAEKLFQVMSAGGADSGVLRKMVPPLLKGDLSGHRFSIGNACKDVTYFHTMADQYDLQSYLAGPLQDLYNSAVSAGLGERFMASLIELHKGVNNT